MIQSTKLQKRGVETKLVIADNFEPVAEPGQTLTRLIAKTYLWHHELSSGAFSSIVKLATHHNKNRSEVSRLLPFAFLAPDIMSAILQGTQPINLTAKKLRVLKFLPHDGVAQRQFLDFPTVQ